MYVDTEGGEVEHVGYIYHFINRDISHNSKPWFQQDRVELFEVEYTRVLP